jgi:hypothetical protein
LFGFARVLKGHDFTSAERASQNHGALAPEGILGQ